jgi:hypothetical protein
VRKATPLLALGICAIWAAHAQDAPPTVVRSVVIVDDKLVKDADVPAPQSGLTVDPVVESAAKSVRRDAEDVLARGELFNPVAQKQPSITVVSVDQVAVSRPNAADSAACVRVGVIGERKDCRPEP